MFGRRIRGLCGSQWVAAPVIALSATLVWTTFVFGSPTIGGIGCGLLLTWMVGVAFD